MRGRKAGKLIEQQEQFCNEYLKDLNATQAYIRVYGVDQSVARAAASRLLTSVSIQQRIAELKSKRVKRLEISADRVLAEIAAVAFARSVDVMEIAGGRIKIKDSDLWSLRSKIAVSEVVETTTEGGGSLRVKMHDKIGALKELAKHVGLYDKGTRSDSDGGFAEVESVLVRLRRVPS
jgi:phage terminase small subunit